MAFPPHVLRRHALALLAIAAATTPAALSLQDETGAPLNLPPGKTKPVANDNVILASDGQPALAGRIPKGTPGDAQELWRRVVASLSVEGIEATTAPRAFDLKFDVRLRPKSGAQNFEARFMYLDHGPGLVRRVVLDSKGKEKSTLMRGVTKGNRLEYSFRQVSGKSDTGGWLRLAGRDAKESMDEIDQFASTCSNIARLTRPGSLRIMSLRVRRIDKAAESAPGWLRLEGDVGFAIPATDIEGVREGRRQKLVELCAGLQWLELTTPDFRLFKDTSVRRRKGPTPIFRLLFGVDPETWRPQIVVVSPQEKGPIQVPGTVLVQSTSWFEHGAEGDKSWLPGRFFAYETVSADGPTGGATDGDSRPTVRFADSPVADLFLRDGGTMRANFTPADFLPGK